MRLKGYFLLRVAFSMMYWPEYLFHVFLLFIISIFFWNIGASRTKVSNSPPSPHGCIPYFWFSSCSFSIVSLLIFLPSHSGLKPWAATLTIMTLNPAFTTSSSIFIGFFCHSGVINFRFSSSHILSSLFFW